MQASGGGYDLDVCCFSQDGKQHQIDYAQKCVANDSLVLGVTCVDGVVIGAAKTPLSSLALPTSGSRLHKVSSNVIAAVAGSKPDGHRLVQILRNECAAFSAEWGAPITGKRAAETLGYEMHEHTCYWSYRPFGCGVLLGVANRQRVPQKPLSLFAEEATAFEAERPAGDFGLWLVSPSGAVFAYRAVAQGAGSSSARSALQALPYASLTCAEALEKLAYIMVEQRHENFAERKQVLEFMSFDSSGRIERLSAERCDALLKAAEDAFERKMDA